MTNYEKIKSLLEDKDNICIYVHCKDPEFFSADIISSISEDNLCVAEFKFPLEDLNMDNIYLIPKTNCKKAF